MRRRGFPCSNEMCKAIVEGLTQQTPAAQCHRCGALCTFPSAMIEDAEATQENAPRRTLLDFVKSIFGVGK